MLSFRRLLSAMVALAFLAGCNAGSSGLPFPGGASGMNLSLASSPTTKIYNTTVKYVERFYPLWFTYGQSAGTEDAWRGPDQVTPLYHIVVLINVDTIYSSQFANLSQPVIITIPNPAKYANGTNFHFSLLALDPYGGIFDTGIPTTTGGTYGLTSSTYGGTLPCGITKVSVPASVGLNPTLIVRADKYDQTSSGAYKLTNADGFRLALHSAPLGAYSSKPGQCNKKAGPSQVLPETIFAIPFKSNADYLAQNEPIGFLAQLQAAVSSARTPPLTQADQNLIRDFNNAFKDIPFVDPAPFIKATRDAHTAIVDYIPNQAKKSTNYWVWFNNIGGPNWSDILRSAITEDCQYCNNHSAAAYFFDFKDVQGKLLDGSKHSYVLTFAKSQIPATQRFWSVTAYTPDALELIPNKLNKYGVASYTPGLQYNKKNGSVSIYMAVAQPKGVPVSNWLPIRNGVFMLGLRDYGPQGSVLANTYTPPSVKIWTP